MSSDFIEISRKQIVENRKISIENHLVKLNSKIQFPYDEIGNVVGVKLLSVVKAREDIYNTTMYLIDKVDTGSDRFIKRIIDGLKNTFTELQPIITMKLGESENDTYQDDDLSLGFIKDSQLSSITKSIELASEISSKILDRIEKLEMSEEEKEKAAAKSTTVNTIERYAED